MSQRQSKGAVVTNVESLETRTMMAVNPVHFTDGRLVIRGTDKAETIEVTINANDQALIDVNIIGKPTKSFDRAKIRKIVIDARGGDDSIFIQKTLTLPTLIEGGFGDDDIRVGEGRNVVYGEKGDDQITGSEGRNFISGGLGDDILRGEGENDTLVGGAGDDSLEGSAGEDVLVGGAGDDTLNGGENEDRLFGNGNSDLFVDAEDDDVRDFKQTKTLVDQFGKKTVIRGDELE